MRADIVEQVNTDMISLEEAIKEITTTLEEEWWNLDPAAIHLGVDSLIIRSVLSNFDIAEWEDEEDEHCDTFRLCTTNGYVVRYLSDEALQSRYYEIHGDHGFYPSPHDIREWFEKSLCEVHGYPDRWFPYQAKPVCSCY